jgi:hypothetical protein
MNFKGMTSAAVHQELIQSTADYQELKHELNVRQRNLLLAFLTKLDELQAFEETYDRNFILRAKYATIHKQVSAILETWFRA